jgi:hypothetical protein
MKRFKFLAMAVLALGMAAPATLSARDFRDAHRDHARVERGRRVRHNRQNRGFRR